MSWKRTVIREVREDGRGNGEEREQIMGTKMLMEKGTREWDKRRNNY